MSNVIQNALDKAAAQKAAAELRAVHVATVRHSLELLHPGPDPLFEIRILDMTNQGKGRPHTASGYFRDYDKAAAAAVDFDERGKPVGVYVTINQPDPRLYNRCPDFIKEYPEKTTTDQEIVRRRWLLVDCDPERPSGISSDDAEQHAAMELAHDCEDFLRGHGWPEPLIGMSGNGYSLLYRIDLPNDTDSTTLVKGVLAGLWHRMGQTTYDPSKPAAKVDLSTFNPARIGRLFGTMNRKGYETHDRPYRRSDMGAPPELIAVVPIEKLKQIAAMAPAAPGQSGNRQSQYPANTQYPRLDVPRWLADHGCTFTTKSTTDGRTVYKLAECPFDPNHGSSGEVCVMQATNGRLSAKCMHDSCSGRGWLEFRDKIGRPDPASHYDRVLKTSERKPTHPKPIPKSMAAPLPAAASTSYADINAELSSPAATSTPTNGTNGHTTTRAQVLQAQAAQHQEHTQPPPEKKIIPVIPSSEFATTDYSQRFIVKKILVADQPAIMGGRSKTMKTSLLTDLALSLGTGSPFLGRFETARTRVAVLSGESGHFTIQETARRIAAAKEVDLSSADVFWGFDLPQLARIEDMDALGEMIVGNHIAVTLIDPAYLCLLGGDTQGRQASNIFDMGPLLLRLTEIGRQTNSTIVLCHHCRKNNEIGRDRWAPPDLEDLAMAGFAEWARQWLLLGRREAYEQGSGAHKLWLNVGGSAGHSGCWSIDVDEGQLEDDFSGRKWDVTVGSPAEAKESKEQEKARRNAEKLERKQGEWQERLIKALKQCPEGETGRGLREMASLRSNEFSSAILALLQCGHADKCTVKKAGKSYEGYRPVAQN